MGRRKQYPEGEKLANFALDSRLLKRVGRFGTANDTLYIAAMNALKAANSGFAAGMRSNVNNNAPEIVTITLPRSAADEILSFAEMATGKKPKFEKALQVVMDIAEQAREQGAV